jgi:hypothetical protein
MFQIIAVLAFVFVFVYVIAWIRYKISPLKRDGTLRNPAKEAIGISVVLTPIAIVVGSGWFIWWLFTNPEVNEERLIGVRTSDEVIFTINDDGTYSKEWYAGSASGVKEKGHWRLRSGILFIEKDSTKWYSDTPFVLDEAQENFQVSLQKGGGLYLKTKDEDGKERSEHYSRVEEK